MDKIRRFFYHYFTFIHYLRCSFEEILDTKLFVSELPRELRSTLSALEDHYFACQYCYKVFPGPKVEMVNQERFACKSCLEKLRRCHTDKE